MEEKVSESKKIDIMHHLSFLSFVFLHDFSTSNTSYVSCSRYSPCCCCPNVCFFTPSRLSLIRDQVSGVSFCFSSVAKQQELQQTTTTTAVELCNHLTWLHAWFRFLHCCCGQSYRLYYRKESKRQDYWSKRAVEVRVQSKTIIPLTFYLITGYTLFPSSFGLLFFFFHLSFLASRMTCR